MAQLAPPPIYQFFDANGLPLVNGQLFTYAAGTTTPLATYTDASAGTPNPNPIILDANGECTVWIGSSAYKFVLKDSLGNVLWTRDNIQYIPDGSISTIMLADGSVTTVKIADANVTTAKLADNSVTTAKILDNNVTTSKIPDGAITTAKLSGSTAVLFKETSDPRYGDGPTAFPLKSWSSPTLIGVPSSPLLGDGNCVRWSHNGKMLAVAENNSEIFAIFSKFGTTLTRLPSPTNAGGTAAAAIAFSPDGQYLAVGNSDIATPGLFIYQRSKNTWGLLATIPITLNHGITGIAWHPGGRSFAVTFNQTPFVKVWNLTDVTPALWGCGYESINGQTIANNALQIVNFEAKIFDPMSMASTGAGWSATAYREGMHRIAFRVLLPSVNFTTTVKFQAWIVYRSFLTSVTNNILVDFDDKTVSGASSTSMDFSGYADLYLYPGDTVSAAVFQNSGGAVALDTNVLNNEITFLEGAQYDCLNTFTAVANPATLPAGLGKSCAWSPDGTFLAVGHATTPFLSIYSFSGTTLTKLSDPASLPADQVNGVSWSPDGSILACAVNSTPFLKIYSRSGTTFTAVANPSTLPAGQANGIAFSSTGDKLAVAHNTSPFVTIYSRSGTTFTKDADPSFLPAGNGKSVAWSPDQQFLAVGHSSSPFMSVYQTAGAYGASAVTYVKEVDLV